jgi:hypothetical protein
MCVCVYIYMLMFTYVYVCLRMFIYICLRLFTRAERATKIRKLPNLPGDYWPT